MSVVPPNESEVIVSRTDLRSVDPNESRPVWKRFLDAVRQTVGLKPLYLAERWTTARVRQEEVDADARLLVAKATYELAMAEARRIELEAKGKFAKDTADAEYVRTHTEILRDTLGRATSPLAAELLDRRSPAEAAEYVNDMIRQIHLHGGCVEIQLPQSPSEDT